MKVCSMKKKIGIITHNLFRFFRSRGFEEWSGFYEEIAQHSLLDIYAK